MTWAIVYSTEAGGWCVADTKTGNIEAGPYSTHDEAVQAAQTMGWRSGRGWKP